MSSNGDCPSAIESAVSSQINAQVENSDLIVYETCYLNSSSGGMRMEGIPLSQRILRLVPGR